MKSAKRYKENLKDFKTKKEELEYYERFKMEYVRKLEDEIASIERFFRSELFDLYSHGANGEYFINRIEDAMDDFFAGNEVMIPNTTYINTKGEHKLLAETSDCDLGDNFIVCDAKVPKKWKI